MTKATSSTLFSAIAVLFKTLTMILCAIALLFSSCGKTKKFEVDGTIEGSPSMNIYVRYYSNGAVQQGVTVAQDGKFHFKALCNQPSILEFADNEGNVMGRLYVYDGAKLQVNLNRKNPYLIEAIGTPENEEWSKFKRDNAALLQGGNSEKINQLIEEYVAEHRQSVVSALILATSYDASLDPVRADSIIESLPAQVRGNLLEATTTLTQRSMSKLAYAAIDTIPYRPTEKDTALYFVPKSHDISLLVFSDNKSARQDSVVPKIKALKKDKPKAYVLDISLTPDTMQWRQSIRNDSASWTQGWAPGGIFANGIDKLALPSLPYYIVVDSAGVQRYRGISLEEAQKNL